MNLPRQGDYIDIHTHDTEPVPGVHIVRTLMAHEGVLPGDLPGVSFTAGIHPWFLTENNAEELLGFVSKVATDPFVVGIGEAGFDRLKGPPVSLQRRVFDEQVMIADKLQKPVIIHCVKAWEELFAAYKRLKTKTHWMVHGFRGKKELAMQLISHGMYLSFWFDFVVQPESTELLRSLPRERIFLETDGSGIDIKDIYNKVASDLDVSVTEMKAIILSNFNRFFCNG